MLQERFSRAEESCVMRVVEVDLPALTTITCGCEAFGNCDRVVLESAIDGWVSHNRPA